MGRLVWIFVVSISVMWLAAVAIDGTWNRSVEDEPVPATPPSPPPAQLVVMDWDRGMIHRARVRGCTRSSPEPLTRITPEDFGKLSIIWSDRMDARDPPFLLRDLATGQIRQPSGLWCWPAENGAAGICIGEWVILDTVSTDAGQSMPSMSEERARKTEFIPFLKAGDSRKP
jgi:hypothetical protein